MRSDEKWWFNTQDVPGLRSELSERQEWSIRALRQRLKCADLTFPRITPVVVEGSTYANTVRSRITAPSEMRWNALFPKFGAGMTSSKSIAKLVNSWIVIVHEMRRSYRVCIVARLGLSGELAILSLLE